MKAAPHLKQMQVKCASFWRAALLVVITGCSYGCKQAPLMIDSAPVNTLTMAVQQGMSQHALASIALFQEKVSTLSNGTMRIELKTVADILPEMEQSTALLFAPNEVYARANANFSSYSSPFYFNDYKQLTLALNSNNFSKLTGDITKSLVKAEPLGAFYDGNSVLVSIREETLETADQYKGIRLYIEENAMIQQVFEKLEAEVFRKKPDDLIEGFNGGKYPLIECDTLRLSKIKLPEKREKIYICHTFHKARVNWLMLSVDTNLTAFEKAVLTEATAYALAKNDEAVLAQEKKGRDHVDGLGATHVSPNYGEMGATTDQILKSSAKYGNIWDWELHKAVRKLANPQ